MTNYLDDCKLYQLIKGILQDHHLNFKAISAISYTFTNLVFMSINNTSIK